MLKKLRLYARSGIILHDLSMTLLAWILALLVRTDFSMPLSVFIHYAPILPLILICQGALLWWAGVYHGLWRFASIPDLWNIMRAAGIGMFTNSLILFLFDRLQYLPRSSLVLYPLFLIFLLGAPRLTYRIIKDRTLRFRSKDSSNVLILGGGKAGEILVRDILHDSDYAPVGFLDDNPRLRGAKIHGVPVLGRIDDLHRTISEHFVDIVVIAMPSANSAQMRRIVALCEESGTTFRTLPSIQDLVSGQVSLRELREVAIEDLLGREPVLLDWKRVNRGLADKVVMVTGGGGSIGSELSNQISRCGISTLVLYEQCEYNLYTISMELKHKFPHLSVHPILGSVTDNVGLDQAMDTYRPDIVFHAAAYKHVPILESHVREAIRNNVLGTKLVALSADRYKCETFVLVSTDKAVNPSSVMGMTKRLAEVVCQDIDKGSNTKFITVRFGNVLGSSGSVVPLFRQQIQSGGPVTVTHPDVTRYFMTIAEASQLIMQAAVMGNGGEIFLLDMGSPIRISYLAEQMIRLSGKTPGKDIEIRYTGLRPGEKLVEELFYPEEKLTKTDHEKIHRLECEDCQMDLLRKHFGHLDYLCQSASEMEAHIFMKDLINVVNIHLVED
jgi:FlaA1/EpsC-like NDP-sugar epimerase